jgi:hypothetical protein
VEAEHRGGLGAVAGQQHLQPYTCLSNRKKQWKLGNYQANKKLNFQ